MPYDIGVHFGSVTDKPVEWRDELSNEPDDGEEPKPTSEDVVGMLGFDPDDYFTPEEGGRKGKGF